MNLNYLSFITISTYLLGALLHGLYLLGQLKYSQPRHLIVAILCLVGHGWILYHLIETPLGQNLDWLVMLSFTLWLMNSVTFLMVAFKSDIENLCVLTYPLSALLLLLAVSFGGSEVVNTKAQPSVLLHIFLSFIAVSLLILASFQATLLSLQNTLLRQHRPATLLRILPPLQTMETMLFHIIWIAMGFFSASLLSGFWYGPHLLTSYLLPKTLLALCAWGMLCSLLIGRYFFGWRGPTAIRWTISGTTVAFLSYFGTKALLL